MKLKSNISWFFRKAGYFSLELSKKIYKSVHQIRVEHWHKLDNKDELRYDYDLNENSVVFDLGGYKGQWTSDIFSRYSCNIYIFEPVHEYFKAIQLRFKKNLKIKAFDFGLGSAHTELMISHEGDSSSLFKGTGDEKIMINCFSDFIKEHRIENIDLLKINIEGAEFDLLDHIIDNNLHKNIKNIQVQFHPFIENAKARMEKIQAELKKTHQLTYQTEFVWENWKLIN